MELTYDYYSIQAKSFVFSLLYSNARVGHLAVTIYTVTELTGTDKRYR
jgi:hypothetical protein